MLSFSEASERNKAPILAILKDVFATTRTVLEIGSGTGQHAVYFAENLPHLKWQPSDHPEAVHWAEQRVQQEGPENLNPPVPIDVSRHPWGMLVDAVFSANTFHIMSWQEVGHFFEGVGEVLQQSGVLCVYGPFRYAGQYTSDSNARFDQSLRAQRPHMGIRDFEAVDELAAEKDLRFVSNHAMPANNQLLVWQRDSKQEAGATGSLKGGRWVGE